MSIGLTIYQLVESNLPADFVVSNDYINTRLKYWQLLLYKAAEIDEADKYSITEWPDDWLILLSYCVTYDLYVRILSGAFIAIGEVSSSSSTKSDGGIKKIVTGPTEVEYHNSSESLTDLLKNIRSPDGAFWDMLQLACAFAQQLGVKLPFCKAKKIPIGLTIGKVPLKGKAYYEYITKKVYGKVHKPKSVG